MSDDYLIGIGKRIKELRKEQKQTIHKLAGQAGISNGLISRVENGRTIPSLPVLLNIIQALDVDVTVFFEGVRVDSEKSYFVSRREEQPLVEREENATGFEYRFLFGKQLGSVGFEAVTLTILPNSEREVVQTDAFELKYVLGGEVYYRIGEEEEHLRTGDALFFDGRIPHVPINRSDQPVSILVVYFFIP